MPKSYRKEALKKQRRQERERQVEFGQSATVERPAVKTETVPSPIPLDLERGKRALTDIQETAKLDYGKYPSYVKALPAAILQNGLGQAMATLLSGAKLGKKEKRSKDEEARKLLYDQVQAWLCQDHPAAPYRGEQELMRAITSHDESAYVRAQGEALAFLRWLKKFAAAFLDQQGTE